MTGLRVNEILYSGCSDDTMTELPNIALQIIMSSLGIADNATAVNEIGYARRECLPAKHARYAIQCAIGWGKGHL